MNKIFLLIGVSASLFAQTLDINALRMAQSNLGSKGIDNGSITNERQVQQIIIIDINIQEHVPVVTRYCVITFPK